MKIQFSSRCLTVLGAAVLLLAAGLSFAGRNTSVILLDDAQKAQALTEQWMDTLAQGDFSAAGELLYGQPTFPDQPAFDDALVATLWDAYRQSISYAFRGDCYASDSGLCRDVTVTTLDISSLLAGLEAQNLTELSQALEAELKGAPPRCAQDLTLKLLYRQDQWWIQADRTLTDLLAGGFAGMED